jgi:hypothetical protein
MVTVLFLMILCHIIDDFVLQPVCLSNLKQKSWWGEHCNGKQYRNDYKMALFIHSLSWSIMIHLPIILLYVCNGWVLSFSILINMIIHYIVDDLKANKYKINLVIDQSIHFIQIILTFIIIFIIL